PRAPSTIAEGEVLQLVSQRDTSTPEATYLEVIKAKTAKLFAAAAEVGAMIAGRNGAERVALESFGMNLGLAFQLVDDALDYSGREAQLGKSVGDDFREGKITLPVILAFLRGRSVEREFWKRTIEKLDQREGDLEQAKQLRDRHGAIADTFERARHYGAMARDALGLVPDVPLKAALLEAVDFAIARAHGAGAAKPAKNRGWPPSTSSPSTRAPPAPAPSCSTTPVGRWPARRKNCSTSFRNPAASRHE